jgi:hypothetical protein
MSEEVAQTVSIKLEGLQAVLYVAPVVLRVLYCCGFSRITVLLPVWVAVLCCCCVPARLIQQKKRYQEKDWE